MLVIGLVLLAGSAIAGVAQPHLARSADTPGKTITVSGHGTVTTVPDRASFDFTVESRAQTAAAAIARTGDAATAVVQAVENAGVPAADLQTNQVSLMPQTSTDGTTVIGYTASETITAETSIAKAGALVDAAVDAGADGVSGPSLSRSDADALYKDALRNAVGDAKDKATALARVGRPRTRPRPVDRRGQCAHAASLRDVQGGRNGADRAGDADRRGERHGDLLGGLEA
jgi:uncharacterized protein